MSREQNMEMYGKMSDEDVCSLIRTAMNEGCIKPAHVYDAVEVVMERLLQRKRRNCDRFKTDEEGYRTFLYEYIGKRSDFGWINERYRQWLFKEEGSRAE